MRFGERPRVQAGGALKSQNGYVSLAGSGMIVYRVIIGLWLGSLAFHSAGFSLIPASIVEYFSSFGFFGDVLLLRGDPNEREVAEAYAGHMIISSLYMFASISLFTVATVRELLVRYRLVSSDHRLPVSLLVVCGVCMVLGSYFILGESHSSFANSDRRFRGMPLWWVMFITTCMWPAVVIALLAAIKNPKFVQERWEVRL